MYHFAAAGDLTLNTTKTTNAYERVILTNNKVVPPHLSQVLRPFQLEAISFLDKHLARGEFCVLNDESGLGKTAVVSVLLSIHHKPPKKCLIIVQNNDEQVSNWEFHLSVLTQLPVQVITSSKDSTQSPYNVYIAKWTTIRSIGDLSKFKFDLIVVDNRGETLANNFCTSMLLKHFEKKVNLVISSVDITSDIKLLHNILRLGDRLEPRYENFKLFNDKFKLPDASQATGKKQVDLELYFLKRAMLADLVNDFRMRRYRHQYDELLPLVSLDTYTLHLKQWRDAQAAFKKPIIQQVVLLSSSDSGSTAGTEQVLAQIAAKPQAKLVPCKPMTADFKPTVELFETIEPPNDVQDEQVIMSPLLFVSDSESDAEEAKAPDPPSTLHETLSAENIEIHLVSSAEEIDAIKMSEENKKRSARKPAEPKKLNVAKKRGPKSKIAKKPEANDQEKSKNASKPATEPTALSLSSTPKAQSSKRKIMEAADNTEQQPAQKRKPGRPCTKDKKTPEMTKDNKPAERTLETTPRQKETQKKKSRLLDIAPKGVHTRETRGMSRLTRSLDSNTKSKYLKRTLALTIDKKCANTNNKPKKKLQPSKEAEKKTNNIKAKETKDKRKQKETEEMPVMSSSDFEEIQCGQKLDCLAETEQQSRKRSSVVADFVAPTARLTKYSMLLSSNLSEPDLMIISPPNHTQQRKTQKGNDVIILSSSLDESSVSSQVSECSRRTLALKQRKVGQALSSQITPVHPASFARVLSKQQRSKSPDLFSNFSEANQINCTQSLMSEDMTSDTARPFDGFKIFGSEVKQYQQQYASQRAGGAAVGSATGGLNGKVARDRSCLDILEKMFEPRAAGESNDSPTVAVEKQRATARTSNTETTITSPRNMRAKATKKKSSIVPRHPIDAIELNKAEQAERLAAKEKLQKSTRATAKKLAETTTSATTNAYGTAIDDEEIFEITNNATFGSRLRVNANGDVTPVPQTPLPLRQKQPNKITKYFSGLLPTATQAPLMATPPTEDEMFDATGKRVREHCGVGNNVKKSPKSLKNQAPTTQKTKLTRWLLKDNFVPNGTSTTTATNAAVAETTAIEKYPTPATTPSNADNQRTRKLTRRAAKNRRRLEMRK